MSTTTRAGNLISIVVGVRPVVPAWGRRLVVALALGVMLAPTPAAAKAKSTRGRQTAKNNADTMGADATPVAGRSGVPAGVTVNACGCYRKGNSCVCTNKNAKCECPDDCEPVGCDEKRQKEMDREMAAEVKRAEEQEKKRDAEEKERARKAAEAERQDPGNETAGDDDTDKTEATGASRAGDKAGDKTADQASDPASTKPSKPSHREKKKKQ